MLMNILKSLAQGHVCSHADLAKQLGVSEGLLAQMMQDLARKGYLASLTTKGQSACGSCRGCSKCSSGTCCPMGASHDPQSWVLTEKGLETANRRRQ